MPSLILNDCKLLKHIYKVCLHAHQMSSSNRLSGAGVCFQKVVFLCCSFTLLILGCLEQLLNNEGYFPTSNACFSFSSVYSFYGA